MRVIEEYTSKEKIKEDSEQTLESQNFDLSK